MSQRGMRVVGIVALAVVASAAPACERSLSPQTGAGLDGAPNESITFEPACADIAVVPRALYRIESWLAPQ